MQQRMCSGCAGVCSAQYACCRAEHGWNYSYRQEEPRPAACTRADEEMGVLRCVQAVVLGCGRACGCAEVCTGQQRQSSSASGLDWGAAVLHGLGAVSCTLQGLCLLQEFHGQHAHQHLVVMRMGMGSMHKSLHSMCMWFNNIVLAAQAMCSGMCMRMCNQREGRMLACMEPVCMGLLADQPEGPDATPQQLHSTLHKRQLCCSSNQQARSTDLESTPAHSPRTSGHIAIDV